MTLQEFVEKHRENLEKFRKVWIYGASTNNWPTELEYPDWQDQLRAWLESEWDKENKE